jgi:hypothetical protein
LGGYPKNSPLAKSIALFGELRVELGPGASFDTLDVSLLASLNGVLNVSLVDGFSPMAGQSFNILDWGAVAGGFHTIFLPLLHDGLSWDLDALYTHGENAVVRRDIAGRNAAKSLSQAPWEMVTIKRAGPIIQGRRK